MAGTALLLRVKARPLDFGPIPSDELAFPNVELGHHLFAWNWTPWRATSKRSTSISREQGIGVRPPYQNPQKSFPLAKIANGGQVAVGVCAAKLSESEIMLWENGHFPGADDGCECDSAENRKGHGPEEKNPPDLFRRWTIL